MKELNKEQLMQVSGGVVFSAVDEGVYTMGVAPGEYFVFSNYKLGSMHVFTDRGEVYHIDVNTVELKNIIYPFKIDDNKHCQYQFFSSFFEF